MASAPYDFSDLFGSDLTLEEYERRQKELAQQRDWSDLFKSNRSLDEYEELQKDSAETGRLGTAGAQFARSGARMATSIPQGLAIAEAQGKTNMLGLFDKVDRGEMNQRDPWFSSVDVQRYMQGTPEEKAALRERFKPTDARESPLYKAGAAAQEAVENVTPSNPAYEQEWMAGKIPSALGSAAGFLATGYAGKTLGLGAFTGPSALGATVQAVDQFEDALNHGASIEKAYDAAGFGAIVGTSEGIPISHALDRLDKVTGGGVKRMMMDVLKQGTEEAIQEFFQTVSSNLIANKIVGYDPDRGTFEGSGEGAGVGFTVGGLTEFVLALGSRRHGRAALERQQNQPPGTAGAQPPPPREPPPMTSPEAQRARIEPTFGPTPPPGMAPAPVRPPTQEELDSPLPTGTLVNGTEALNQFDGSGRIDDPPSALTPPPGTVPPPVPTAPQAENWEPLYDENDVQIGEVNRATGAVRKAQPTTEKPSEEGQALPTGQQEIPVVQSPTAPEGKAAEPGDGGTVPQSGEPARDDAQQVAPTLRTDGKPWPTEEAARKAAGMRKDFKGKEFETVPVEGGFGLRLKTQEASPSVEGSQTVRGAASEPQPSPQQPVPAPGAGEAPSTGKPLDEAMDELGAMFGAEPKATPPAAEHKPHTDQGDGTSRAPVEIKTAADMDVVRERVAREPTDGQKDAENYAQGHAIWNGHRLGVETIKGGTRRSKADADQPWEVKNHPTDYGKFKDFPGADGDKLDFHMGPNPESKRVFVIDQFDTNTQSFDEHKVMIGFNSQEEAQAAYDRAFTDGKGPRRRVDTTEIDLDTLDQWGPTADKSGPIADTKFAKKTAAAKTPENTQKPNETGETPQPREPEKTGIDDFDNIFDEAMGNAPKASSDATEASSEQTKAPSKAPDAAPAPKYPRTLDDGTKVTIDVSRGDERSNGDYKAYVEKDGTTATAVGKSPEEAEAKALETLRRPTTTPPAPPKTGTTKVTGEGGADAITFLASRGGLRDDEGHGLSARRNLDRFIPGYGQLIRKNGGMSIDEAGRLLWDEGYFGPTETTPRPTENQTLNFIEKDFRTKTYIPEMQGEKETRTEIDPEVEAAAQREELNAVANEYGIDPDGLTNEELEALVAAEKAKDEAIDAEERAAIQAVENELNQVENAADEEAPPLEGPTARPGDQGAGTPDDARGDGQEAAPGSAEESTGGGESVPGGSGPRDETAGQEPTAQEDGVAPPPAVEVKDVGERLEGARKHAYETLDEALKGDDAAAATKLLLEETNRSKLMPIALDEKEASVGARAYLERFRGKMKTFLDVASQFTGGGRKKSRWSKAVSPTAALADYLSGKGWNEESVAKHRKSLLEAAADYTAFVQEIENLTKNALTIEEASEILGRAFFTNYSDAVRSFKDGSEKLFGRKMTLTDFGSKAQGYMNEFPLRRLFDPDTGAYVAQGLKDDMTVEDREKAKPLVSPKLDKIVREGLPERRPGNKNVTPEDFMTTFGFRGVQFGNYMDDESGMRAINYAYDALLDLAETLNIEPKNIGFPKDGKRMGIAFGARGKGGKAAAHYEPVEHVINITKNAGDGTLAHEWMHALDFALRASKTDGTRYTQMVTQLKNGLERKYDLMGAIRNLDRLLTRQIWISGNKKKGPIESAREFIEFRWDKGNWGGMTDTTFARQAKELGTYWRDPVELWARAGEAAIFDMIPGKSPYLVNDWVADGHVSKSTGYRGTPYPGGDERIMFTAMYAGMFNALRFGPNGEVGIDENYAGPMYDARKQVQDALNKIGKDLEGRRDRLMGRDAGGQDAFSDPEMRAKRFGTVAKYWNDDNLNREGLGMAFADYFANPANSFTSSREALKMAEELVGAAITTPVDLKAVEEAVELGVVLEARRIFERMSQDGASHDAIFQALVDLYQRMPPLLTRTSTSATNQAYSTPVPIAYLANVLGDVTPETTLYEPTAGQGALALTATANLVFANELDPKRARALTLQGFQVSNTDALLNQMSGVDRVIANPPFGNVKDDKGQIRTFKTPMFETTSVDHAIALKALESLKKDGKAVLIIAGQKHLGADPKGERRQQLYNAPKNRAFFKYLYDTYNVVEHFTIDGSLYKRQGAAWPIDIIVISGRGKSESKLPGASAPVVYDSFDALKRFLNGTPHGTTERVLDTQSLGLGPARPAADVGSGDNQSSPDADEGGLDERPGSPSPRPSGSGTGGGTNRRPRAGGEGPAVSGPGQQEGVGGNTVRGGASDQGSAGAEQPDVAGGREGEQSGGGERHPGDDAGKLADRDRQLNNLDNFDNLFDDALKGGEQAASLDAPPTTEATQSGQGPVDEAEGKPRTALEAGKSAVINTVQGLDQSMDALAKLFGADPSRLTSGIGFDPETYKKAKPLFISALEHFKGAAVDVKEMVVAFINHARNVRKWADDVIQRLKPYLKQFITEALNGDIPGFGQKKRPQNSEVATQFQVPYEPASKAGAVGTLMPVNMRTAVVEALEGVAQRNGDIDTYVANKLGMSIGQLTGGAFSAEQIDALALAIDNVEQGKGFIIGDQTGVGKGRFVAGMIKYALNQGYTPIFITKDPKLYGDMYRDTSDIGMGDQFKPLITNNDATIALDDGRSVRSLSGDRNKLVLKDVAKNGRLPDNYNLLMTTYDQLNTIAGRKFDRHAAIEALASNAMFILDESHEAGGSEGGFTKIAKDGTAIQPRSDYVRQLIASARGVVYSSATYAKNPYVMTLYFKTDMAEAVDEIKDLTETIKRGGVPLQQAVANMLVKAGQYLRRERSFDGVQFSTKKADINIEAYRGMASLLRDIFELDSRMTEVRKAYGKYLAETGEGLGMDNAVGDTGVTSATFSSMMHNVIGQSLMALKADAAAQEAIDAWKAGKKPVIALANTLGSFLDEHIDEHGLKTGSDVTAFTFNQLFTRYLKRTRTVTIKDPFDKEKKTKHYITDDELTEMGFADLIEAFEQVGHNIEGTDLTSVPASPIDHMLERMRAAGMKVDEITGRTTKVETKNGVKKLATRTASIAEKGRVVNGYNDGSIDGLVINKSGSTGLSIHASSKYKDKKTRLMILMQADPNIDVFMQMLGRIHRTGQVVPPEYVVLAGNVPAERRPAAITAGKMKSLNANTSANSDSAFTDAEAVDFLNRYGDEVVADILLEDPGLQAILDVHPTSPKEGENEGTNPNEGLARKVTGRASILSPEEQEALFDRITTDYNAEIARLDALGENALVAKPRDLLARTIKKFVLVEGKGEGSPFVEPAYLERLEVNRQGRPHTIDRVQAMVEEVRGDQNSSGKWFRDRENQQKTMAAAYIAPIEEKLEEARKEIRELFDARREFAQANGNAAAHQKFGPLIVAAELKEEKAKNRVTEATELNNIAMGYLYLFQPGRPVKITTGAGEDAKEFLGIVIDHDYAAKAKNPLALSNSVIKVAVADAVREIEIPYSQLHNKRYEMVAHDQREVRAAFDTRSSTSRENRWMITGNLLSGFNTFRKGQMTIYTDEGGNVREGILMAPKFDPDKEMGAKSVRFATVEQIADYLKQAPVSRGVVTSTDGAILITRDSSYDYLIKVKPKGGRQYFTNANVVEAIGQFVQKGGKGFYTAKTTKTDTLVKALKALAEVGEIGWQTDQFKDIAKKITGEKQLTEVPVERPPGAAMMALRRKVADKALTEKIETVDGLRDQFVIPGAEQTPEQAAKAERDRQRAELDLRARQSKLRTGKAQQEPGGLFGEPGQKQGTLFARQRIEPTLRNANGQSVADQLTARLRQMDPTGRLELVVVPQIRQLIDGELFAADGSYLEKLITIALDSESTGWVLDHEIIHAFRDLGLIKPAEWAALTRMVKSNPARMKEIRDRYLDAYKQKFPDSYEDKIIEEAVADLHADWRNGGVDLKGFQRSAFQRIQDLLRTIWEVLTGQGFNTPAAIFDRIATGEMGSRTSTGTRAERAAVNAEAILAERTAFVAERMGAGDTMEDIRGLPAYREFSDRIARAVQSAGSDVPSTLKATPRFAAAWHGSPSEFDTFDISKVDTGEGAQAFGWGLYFSGERAVAEEYRRRLSGRGQQQWTFQLPEETRLKILVDGLRKKIAETSRVDAIDKDVLERMSDAQLMRQLKEAAEAKDDNKAPRAVSQWLYSEWGRFSVLRDLLTDGGYTAFMDREDSTNYSYASTMMSWLPNNATPEEARREVMEKISSIDRLEKQAAEDEARAKEAEEKGDVERARSIRDFARNSRWFAHEYTKAKAFLDKFPEAYPQAPFTPGRLYKVELAPREDEYLMWDDTIGSQPEGVRKAAEEAMVRAGNDLARDGGLNHLKGYQVYDMLAERLGPEVTLGPKDNPALQWPVRARGDKEASMLLKSLGVRGIKYLDGMSRSQGEGTSNYVIFDNADIRIVERYSLPRDDQERERSLDEMMGALSANYSKAAEIVEEDGVGIDANLEGIIKLLGSKMYDSSLVDVTLKELLQNSFDAVKQGLAVGGLKAGQGRVDVKVDESKRSITFTDNGYGMSPEIVQEAFLKIAGTNKDGLEEAMRSGGLGLAKMAFLFGNDRLVLKTVRNGVMTELDTSGPELIAKKAKRKITRGVKEQNGTTITVVIPKTYTKNGETHEMPFNLWTSAPGILKNPLVGDIEVTYEYTDARGKPQGKATVPTGRNLDLSKQPKVTTAHFPWGDVEVYMSEKGVGGQYPDHIVLSSGLYQFTSPVMLPGSYSERIPYKLIFNVLPKVDAHAGDYPFNNQREDWNKSAQADINALKMFFQAWSSAQNAEVSGKEYARAQVMPVVAEALTADQAGASPYLFRDPGLMGLMPSRAATSAIPTDINIKGGQADIDYPKMMDLDNFTIDLKNVPVDAPLMHSNLNVDIIEKAAKKSKIPPQRLRYVVARLGTLIHDFAKGLGNVPRYEAYKDMRAAGVIFTKTEKDVTKGIQGVNITVPYAAMFVNPFGPFASGLKRSRAIASSLVHTMMHEGVHETQRNHSEAYTTDMSWLYGTYAEFNPDTDPSYYQDRIEELINEHRDAWDALKAVYDDAATANVAGAGAGITSGVGQGLPGGGADRAREDGGAVGAGDRTGSERDAEEAARRSPAASADLGRVDPTETPEFNRWFGSSKVVDADGNPRVFYHSTSAVKDFEAFRRRLGDVGIHFGTIGQAEDRADYTRDKRIGEQGGERMIPVYLSIKNPLRLRDIGSWNADNLEYALRDHPAFQSEADKKFILTIMQRRWGDNGGVANAQLAALRDFIERKGYDGIVYKNTGEVEGGRQYAAAQDAARAAMIEAQRRRGRPVNVFDAQDRETPEYQAYWKAFQEYTAFRENNGEDSYIAFRPEQIKSIFNRGTFNPRDKRMMFSLRRTETSPAFADFNERKIRNFASIERYGAWFTRVDARKFIELTTPPNRVEELMNALPKTSNIEPYDKVDREFDPENFDLPQQFAVPFLRVDDNGKVTSHEGRHRAASLLRAGARTMPIAIIPDYRAAWADTGAHPEILTYQTYSPGVQGSGSLRLPGGSVAHVPRNPTDAQVKAALKIVGPESNPNPPGGGKPMFALRPRAAGPAGGIFGDQTQNLARDEDAHEETVMPLIEALRQPGSMIPESVRAAADRWRTAIQDRFLPLLRTQQAIEESLGRPLTDEENAYRAETNSYGRKGAKLDDLANDHITPLFEEMQRRNVSVDELEMYLYARHAPERNARIASINPEFAEGEGSGMTDAEAEEIMNAVEESGKLLDIEWLAARVDDIRDAALRERVQAGLLSQEQADAWRETYQNYVPLRGRGELDPTLEADRPRLASGISVKGPESRRAFGRRSRATDILAYTIMQAQEAILRAENNRVAQAFHQLAVNNPNPDFWKVNKITTKPVWNSATGQVEYRSSSRISAEDADYTISLKIDGTEHRVTLNRDNADAVRLAEAMRNLKPEQINGFIQVFGSINRVLSTVNTTLNYEFVITNAFRDLQTATVNLTQFDMPGIVSKTIKDYLPAMKAATKGAFHNFEGEWGRWYKEFRDAGGRVYFNTVEDIRQQRRNVEKAVRNAQPGFSARRAVSQVFQVIERLNNGVENAIRLAAYKNAREAGLSKDQAAELAKNLTVDFNRRGSYGPLINSLYLFFNASVQGTATLLTAMRSPTVRKVLGGAVATGALVSILNAMVAGYDDDDENLYDKIPEFDKQRNLIIMDPFSGFRDYWKIPLPYGYNVFFNIGRGMVDLARGKDVGKVMAAQAEAIVDSFNPIGGAQNLLNMVAPTIVDPLVDLFRNRDFADRPIMPENPAYGPPIPNNQRYWGSVSPFWRTVTDTLNTISGGDDVVPGKIDWSPEVLDYVFGVATGAAGLSWERLAGLPMKIMDPTSEMTWNDIPMMRRVKGTKAPWIDRDLFYDRTQEVALHMRNYKDYAKKERMDEADAYYEANKEMINLAPMADKIRDVLALTRRTNAADRFREQKGEITREEYLKNYEERRAIEQEYITLFNRSYLEAKKANGN